MIPMQDINLAWRIFSQVGPGTDFFGLKAVRAANKGVPWRNFAASLIDLLASEVLPLCERFNSKFLANLTSALLEKTTCCIINGTPMRAAKSHPRVYLITGSRPSSAAL
jgi:hypothetical protein